MERLWEGALHLECVADALFLAIRNYHHRIGCRWWAKQYGDVYIVCGPVFMNREHETIGANGVFVPEAFFKVILCLNGEPKGMGFVVKNTAGTKKRDLYYNSIDQVERITGMDFFPNLPDDMEEVIESKLDLDQWR